MPVSAVMLVTHGGGGPQNMSGGGPQFVRGDRGTSSVKLRGRRDDVNQPGRKKNRHSGDFSLFSTKKESEIPSGNTESREEQSCERSDSDGDDWNYITFPNGVPNVQEVKTEINAMERDRVVSQPPLKVTMREMPVMTQVKHRSNISANRPVSTSVINIHAEAHKSRNHAKSGDFSHFNANKYQISEGNPEPLDPNIRRRPHLRSQSQQPAKNQNTPSQSVNISSVHSHLHVTPTRVPRNIKEQPTTEPSSATKFCNSEFEFKKADRRSGDFSLISQDFSRDLDKSEEKSIIERMIKQELHGDSLSEGSEESGIFSTGSSQDSPQKYSEQSRKPGLGRRAITQINMRDRKNSYTNALAKSQENLVKISSDCAAEEVFEDATTTSNIKKGLLWQQRDKLFSRWKERYFILTKDFLQCFKKETSKITDMGGFIFKIKLSDVDSIELLDKRGYLTICLNLLREGKVYLRKTEGIRDWYNCIRENMQESKEWKQNRSSAIFADNRQKTDYAGMENYVAEKQFGKTGFSDSSPEINKTGNEHDKHIITLAELNSLYKNAEQEEPSRLKETESKNSKSTNRLSLVSDIGLLDRDNTDSLEIDLEKGMFPRRNFGYIDSGNNSLNTNHSTNSSLGSSKMSAGGVPCLESSFMEEDEEDYSENIRKMPSPEIRISRPQINKNIVEVRYRERSSNDVDHNKRRSSTVSIGHNPPSHSQKQERRRSQNVNRLQITHV